MAYETTIKKNADFRLSVTWKQPDGTPVDLTGATGRLQFREDEGGTVLLDLTTENGGIELGDSLGTIDVLSLASTHVSLPAKTLQGDLLIFNGGATDCVLEIQAVVTPGITPAT